MGFTPGERWGCWFFDKPICTSRLSLFPTQKAEWAIRIISGQSKADAKSTQDSKAIQSADGADMVVLFINMNAPLNLVYFSPDSDDGPPELISRSFMIPP